MKRLFMLSLVLMLALSLAACGSSSNTVSDDSGGGSAAADSEEEDAGGNDQEEITLRVAWWGSQTRHDSTLEVIKMYEEENPHVTVESEFTGFDGYWEKMSAQAAGNNLPDVMQQNFGEYLTQYADKGLLADLTEFTEDGTIDLSNFSDLVVDSGEMDGKLLGIPLGMNAYAAMYDPEMIEAAGAPLPDNEWTWDDFKEIAGKVAENNKYGSSVIDDGIRNGFDYFSRQHGQGIFNEDGTGLGYDDQVLIDYWHLLLDLQESGITPPPDIALEHEDVENSLLAHGDAAFQFRWSNQGVAIASSAGKDLKMATVPGGPEAMFVKPAMFFSISESSDKKEEAAKFIDFFVNNIEAQKVQELDRGVPPSSVVRETMKDDLSAMDQEIFDYVDYILENGSPIDKAYPVAAAEVLVTMEEYNERVLYGELSPEDAAKQFREEAEALISK